MSSLATIIKDDALASTLRVGIFSLAACSVVGLAAYVGYKAAGPNKTYALQNRPPELNEQVKTYEIDFIILTLTKNNGTGTFFFFFFVPRQPA
jgi:hypothetical protein